jgi:hypothetical protein
MRIQGRTINQSTDSPGKCWRLPRFLVVEPLMQRR